MSHDLLGAACNVLDAESGSEYYSTDRCYCKARMASGELPYIQLAGMFSQC